MNKFWVVVGKDYIVRQTCQKEKDAEEWIYENLVDDFQNLTILESIATYKYRKDPVEKIVHDKLPFPF